MQSTFTEQVRLLVRVLPMVAKERCFALKGGTAINLFYRDMPRLSVDIDLAYLPLRNRDESLEAIDAALKRIEEGIRQGLPGAEITHAFLSDTKWCIRLTVHHGGSQVKIEVTPVLRGSVHDPMEKELSPTAAQRFGYVKMQLLSFEDLYGGKICAALDRQHPRDLFDVKLLLENEGIDTALKNTFLVYLLSHNRPMAEMLAPHRKEIDALFEKEFRGMTEREISVDALVETREHLIETIHAKIEEKDKAFLHSFKAGEPKWELFAYPQAAQLPAVRWKLHNVQKMSKSKRQTALEKLDEILSNIGATR